MRDNCDPDRREAVALAKYLNRIWDVAATLDAPTAYALDLLTAFDQFDVALTVLNPNPTVGEAMSRIYAYQPVIAWLQRETKRDEANPKPLPPGRLNQIPAQLHRMNRQMALRYGPLFARALIFHFRV